jgi:hypothetical protein
VAAVGEAVEQGRGHLGVRCPAMVCKQTMRGAKDRGPFAEAKVRGDHDAGAFVEFAQQMEQQRPARAAEWQIAELVQDHEVELGHGFGDLLGFALGLFLFEGVDQFDGREKVDLAAVVFDGLNADGRCDMGFAGARAADQEHVLRPIHELVTVQSPDGRLVDLTGHKVESREVLVGRGEEDLLTVWGTVCPTNGRLHVIGDCAELAFGQFGFQKL